MRSIFMLSLLATVLFAALPGVVMAAPQNRVVFHLSDGDASIWRQAFNNSRNVQRSFGKGNVAVALVINGNAIGVARADSAFAETLSEAVAAGIEVIVCENTMKERNIRREDMHKKLVYTPVGTLDIMKKQQEGWAYIKP